jgi:hypothetical protein
MIESMAEQYRAQATRYHACLLRETISKTPPICGRFKAANDPRSE